MLIVFIGERAACLKHSGLFKVKDKIKNFATNYLPSLVGRDPKKWDFFFGYSLDSVKNQWWVIGQYRKGTVLQKFVWVFSSLTSCNFFTFKRKTLFLASLFKEKKKETNKRKPYKPFKINTRPV